VICLRKDHAYALHYNSQCFNLIYSIFYSPLFNTCKTYVIYILDDGIYI
jgi:hypothetical protein